MDRESQLWNDYKRAKEIRNRVTHIGRRVSRNEAKFVVQTVYKWLAFLGSTVEVELALQGLKIFIETSSTRIDSETEGSKLVRHYFRRTKSASLHSEPQLQGLSDERPDLILRFGDHTVLVEVKFLLEANLLVLLERAVLQTVSYLQQSGINRAALVVLCPQKIPEPYQKIRTLEDGRLSLVVIRV